MKTCAEMTSLRMMIRSYVIVYFASVCCIAINSVPRKYLRDQTMYSHSLDPRITNIYRNAIRIHLAELEFSDVVFLVFNHKLWLGGDIGKYLSINTRIFLPMLKTYIICNYYNICVLWFLLYIMCMVSTFQLRFSHAC